MIARRHVIHVSGYDPVEPARHHRRFRRELATFAKIWTVEATAAEAHATPVGALWEVTTRGPNWRVDTVYESLDWHDIVRGDLARSMGPRLVRAVVAFADFIVSGTVSRYFAASHRYGLFFLVPLAELVAFAGLSLWAGWWLSAALAAGGLVRAGVALIAAAALFTLLLRWPGRQLRLDQAMEDWIFARDYMHAERTDVETRLDLFAGRLIEVARTTDADEILIVGHSLGALLVLDVIDRALTRDPQLMQHRARMTLLTVGATIPKLTLHPDGERFRACARRVAASPGLDWGEYQARDDAISFYKFHPVTSRRLADDDGETRPLVRRVQMHEMLGAASYAHYRWRFMRMHYQFVMANECRAAYDFFMLTCGPISLLPTIQAARGAVDMFGENGALLAEQGTEVRGDDGDGQAKNESSKTGKNP
jgi:hypothetical protein